MPTQAQLQAPLPNLTGIVKDKNAAIALGKAFFWDQQIGSDLQSCASCHFVAGADTRIQNEMNPGFNDITYGPTGDTAFGSTRSDTGQVPAGYMPSGALAGPNYTLTAADFPLFQLLNELDRNSPVVTGTNDRVGPAGSFSEVYDRSFPLLLPDDVCSITKASAAIFRAGPYPARQVEPRQAPTVVNAALNNRQFWDGRANNMFNGVGPFGMRDINGDPSKRLVFLDGSGNPYLGYLQLPNASLASQAMAPPVASAEMSCSGRTFKDVGRKMILRQPLEVQAVDAHDSVLGSYRSPLGLGLNPFKYTYGSMIKAAFADTYWKDTGKYTITSTGVLTKDPNGYSQMETNFSMFWGIAIMLYEATLISDQSEFDSLVASGDLNIGPGGIGCTTTSKVDPLLAKGCRIFHGTTIPIGGGNFLGGKGGNCLFCHANPTFSENQVSAGQSFSPFLNPVPDVEGTLDIRDLGFHNIGVKPYTMDLALGGTDPYGNPLSYGMQYHTGTIVDPFLQNATTLGTNPGGIPTPISNKTVTKLAIAGSVKVPTLRNVALTPPYFMWGGYASLRQAMKVYNRGGNRRDIPGVSGNNNNGTSTCTSGDDSGSGPAGLSLYPITGSCATNVNGVITNLGLEDCDHPNPGKDNCATDGVANDDLAALVRYLKALTDRRVQCDVAPFDHPSLYVFHGHYPLPDPLDGLAQDKVSLLPAVGAGGYAPASGYCVPNAGDLFAPGMQGRSGGLQVPLN
jgi:cytochrome c peroxidase